MGFDFLPAKIRALLRVDQESGCWLFIGHRWSRNGYGRVRWEKAERQIHRVVWSILRGPICYFIELDHACRNRACSNPDHLDPVFGVVNTHRGVATLFKRPEAYHD